LQRHHVANSHVDQIARTVHRTPEVMIKVLAKGAAHVSAAKSHIQYIGRRGDIEINTDDDRKVSSHEFVEELSTDWNLDLDEQRPSSQLKSADRRSPPRIIHKVIFSMPAGTHPELVLKAVQAFCREEFSLSHRYALALHTDEPHPHVHVVIKALTDQGERLNIRKDTLRAWRIEFAKQLRALGVAANATSRVDRGNTQSWKRDGIYRAALRSDSSYERDRATKSTQSDKRRSDLDLARLKLKRSREDITRAWRMVASILKRSGQPNLAMDVEKFLDEMPPPWTDQERRSQVSGGVDIQPIERRPSR
jgi:hypothetical protein